MPSLSNASKIDQHQNGKYRCSDVVIVLITFYIIMVHYEKFKMTNILKSKIR